MFCHVSAGKKSRSKFTPETLTHPLGGSSRCKWLITMVIVTPLKIGLWGMAFSWLVHGGDPNHLKVLGSSEQFHPNLTSTHHQNATNHSQSRDCIGDRHQWWVQCWNNLRFVLGFFGLVYPCRRWFLSTTEDLTPVSHGGWGDESGFPSFWGYFYGSTIPLIWKLPIVINEFDTSVYTFPTFLFRDFRSINFEKNGLWKTPPFWSCFTHELFTNMTSWKIPWKFNRNVHLHSFMADFPASHVSFCWGCISWISSK